MNPILPLLKKLPEIGASDLHISADQLPMARFNRLIKPLKTHRFEAHQTEAYLVGLLDNEQKEVFERDWNIDFCLSIQDTGRFRANIFKQRNGIDGVFRYIPPKIPTPQTLGLNKNIVELAGLHQGIVIIAGPTRTGKSTTLASLLDTINHSKAAHIITIEDPIEFIYTKSKALINQREIGTHTKSMSNALRAALREDPDIVMVGEMRDLETIQLAISAAETGHLVLTTMQTKSAQKTIDRIIDSFPPSEAAQIRAMLSESLRAVICQQLLSGVDGKKMFLAQEILLSSTSLANMIRDGKTYQIPSILQTGQASGMKKMDVAILELLKMKKIDREEAVRAAHDPKEMAQALGGRVSGAA